jgi:hypothetical protein
VNFGEIRHLLDLDALSTEERGHGRGLVAGDDEDARAADDLDPAFGDVVAGMGVRLRKDADGIPMAPRTRATPSITAAVSPAIGSPSRDTSTGTVASTGPRMTALTISPSRGRTRRGMSMPAIA